MGSGTVWGGNVLTQNSPNFSGSNAVAIAQNTCDSTLCSRLPGDRRRFYMSGFASTHQNAGDQCAAGFRLAQLGELDAPSALEYADGLGQASVNVLGFPFGEAGWITGGCNTASFVADPAVGDVGWQVEAAPSCLSARRVWCIEE